jgi:hypothetical protein
MRTAAHCVAAAALMVAAAGGGARPGHAAEPQIFAHDAWVCATPEAYDQAIGEASRTRDREALADRLRGENLCTLIEDDDIEDIMPPFVEVLEHRDGKVRVTFIVENYRRVATLHARINWVKFTGWTDASNLEAY